jgi:hypothetical protein
MKCCQYLKSSHLLFEKDMEPEGSRWHGLSGEQIHDQPRRVSEDARPPVLESSSSGIDSDDESRSSPNRQKLNLWRCRSCRESRKKVHILLVNLCVGYLS